MTVNTEKIVKRILYLSNYYSHLSVLQILSLIFFYLLNGEKKLGMMQRILHMMILSFLLEYYSTNLLNKCFLLENYGFSALCTTRAVGRSQILVGLDFKSPWLLVGQQTPIHYCDSEILLGMQPPSPTYSYGPDHQQLCTTWEFFILSKSFFELSSVPWISVNNFIFLFSYTTHSFSTKSRRGVVGSFGR